jgi:predicted RNase H-like nuclease
MNVIGMEAPLIIEAKTTGSNSNRNVTYSPIDTYHNVFIDKKDLILAQIHACERLLKYTNDRIDQIILEKEIADLKLMLDLIE